MRDKLSNALWGLFFILIGIGFAGNVLFDWSFTLLFPGWWTLFIIIPCFISMIRNGFGIGSTIGFIIGVLLLASYYVELYFNIWQLVVPAILIFIGVRILFQGAFHRRLQYDNQNMNSGSDTAQGPIYTDTARREFNAIFSSSNTRITENFAGASMNAVFGSVVLDLRDAKLPGDVEISAQAIFGGIDIYVPNGVRVKINNVPIFGGVSNKTGGYIDPAAPTIYLNSTCMFGGIDIK